LVTLENTFKNRRDISATKKRRANVLRITCSATHCCLFIYVSVDFMRKQAKELATGASELINFMHRKQKTFITLCNTKIWKC
jgi:hypothetical protein